MLKTFKNLDAWQVSMMLVERCYLLTREFPRDELLGLTSQMRRAAISLPSNVAEDACRKSRRAFCNHISIAIGSHAELETCLEIARRLHYASAQDLNDICDKCAETGRLLNGLYRSLSSDQRRRDTSY
jgi:four helix bundle protein